ncbi:GRB10-interacting GYF protein 1 isoform X5 [Eleginops maclovinus]|uniref:GRB10-interacting GYF protein 1 isoform X5 n=1 Tax=Eleginops maclovinus TaxID=56733 RepID=UPI003080BA92
MTAETLNFGPEWLRALSSGGSVTSPPPSPAMPKYKLAEYRYGREEMLALYIKDNKVPEDMQDKEFAAILQDEPMQPLALVPLTDEEQRNFSMSVNSVAVLRLMGKGVGGAVAPAGVVRGRGAARGGRGRGRGEGGFYQRSIEEPEVGFGRSVREIHRSQSWDDRGERRFEKPLRREVGRPGFEEPGAPVVPGRKDFTRADSDNWRILREEQQEEEEAAAAAGAGVGAEPGTNWRLAGVRRDDGGPRSAGWREHTGPGEGRRRKFDYDIRDADGHGGGRRRAGSEGLEDDRDGLPEWCNDEEDGEMGTFDSSGAFMPLKKGDKDTILEEEFKGIEDDDEEESYADMERHSAEEEKESKEAGSVVGDDETKPASPSSSPPALQHCTPPSVEPRPSNAGLVMDNPQLNNSHPVKASSTASEDMAPVGGSKSQLSPSAPPSSRMPPPPPSSAAPLLPPPGGDAEDDEGMKHLQQEAEKMVASLQDTSLEEECFTQALQQQQESRNTAAALPLSHEAAMKWFYKDPQGEIQGPFTTVEMCEWFQAGYFTMTLLVKRGCDEGFQPLGDVIKMWGRVPFAPGPSPPPLLVRQPPPTQRTQPTRGPAGTGNLDQDRLKKQQELAATAVLYQQLQQQQQLIQLYREQGMMPSMNRSMSVPDTGSMWDMHTSASQPSGGEASLWDITMNPSTQGPTLEQLQKLQQERRDAELRAKREEEEQRKRREEKRRLQEEQQQQQQKRREEEDLFRRKQCRQQQELIMKLLQQTPQQQGPGAGSSGWSGAPSSGLSKAGKPPALALLEMQQEAERLLKQQQQQQQQRAQQQRERHSGMSMGSSSMGGQWADGVGMWGGPGGMEGKSSSGSSSGSMGMWDEAVKNQSSLRGNSNNNMGLKNSRSSPSLSDQYMMRRKRTEDEDKLLKLLQGMKPQDGFTTWCEQMLHALNTSANSSSSCSVDVATIVAYLKEVESPYAVLEFIRSYLGDTVEAKEFAKQFLERRAKQKANQQRQQQQLSKEVAGLNMNFPLQDSMRGMNPSNLQSMFQASHMGKSGLYDNQGGKMKKKQPMMLHPDPSILGYSFHNVSECLSLNEMEMVEDY